jgi:hypothetical protein
VGELTPRPLRWPTVKLEMPSWRPMTSPLEATSSPAVVGHLLALLFEIGGEELLVVAAGDEADLLRVGLLGERQAGTACHFAHLGLGHAAEREERAGELLLGEAEEEVGLVLGQIGGALEDPALAGRVVLVDGVVAGGDAVGADGARGLMSSWSNLRWLLQSEQGIGVRPARYSSTKGRTTSFSKRSCWLTT